MSKEPGGGILHAELHNWGKRECCVIAHTFYVFKGTCTAAN